MTTTEKQHFFKRGNGVNKSSESNGKVNLAGFFSALLLLACASTAHAGWHWDVDRNRPGSDYKHFVITGKDPRPGLCAVACSGNARCKAWTFNVTDSSCWLKDSVPRSSTDARGVSGVVGAGGYVQSSSNLQGSDFDHFTIGGGDEGGQVPYDGPDADYIYQCYDACISERSKCQAWTFDIRNNSCWLKDSKPGPQYVPYAVSGTLNDRAAGTKILGMVIQVSLGTNLQGGDYKHFTIPPTRSLVAPTKEEQCQESCKSDTNCQAWTFDARSSTCWLKNDIPELKDASGCCTSGALGQASTDMPGTASRADYANFPKSSARDCMNACSDEPGGKCKAWTYVKSTGRCWLKNKVPPSTNNGCCISDVRQ